MKIIQIAHQIRAKVVAAANTAIIELAVATAPSSFAKPYFSASTSFL